MGRKGITYDQVAAAADALVAQGATSVGNAAVRAYLGNTGSLSSIHKHLAAWRENRPKITMPPRNIPDDLLRSLHSWMTQESTQARADAEERLVQALAAADELARAGEELETERDELQIEIAALTTQRDQEQATAEERAAEIQRLLADVERERSLAGAAQVDAAAARLRADSQVEHLAELRERVELLSGAIETERAARIAAERDVAVLTSQIAGARAELDAARAQTATLQQDLTAARERAEQARSEADARAQQDQARIDQLRQDYEIRLEEQRRVIEHARGQLASTFVEKAHLEERLTLLESGTKE